MSCVDTGVDLADDADVEQVVANADGVDDVDGEERNPAQQKHACKQDNRIDRHQTPPTSSYLFGLFPLPPNTNPFYSHLSAVFFREHNDILAVLT